MESSVREELKALQSQLYSSINAKINHGAEAALSSGEQDVLVENLEMAARQDGCNHESLDTCTRSTFAQRSKSANELVSPHKAAAVPASPDSIMNDVFHNLRYGNEQPSSPALHESASFQERRWIRTPKFASSVLLRASTSPNTVSRSVARRHSDSGVHTASDAHRRTEKDLGRFSGRLSLSHRRASLGGGMPRGTDASSMLLALQSAIQQSLVNSDIVSRRSTWELEASDYTFTHKVRLEGTQNCLFSLYLCYVLHDCNLFYWNENASDPRLF
jgi:hypothetical protein